MIDSKQEQAKGTYSRAIKDLERRKLEAHDGTGKALWFGFGTVGMIGWSVVLPTMGGIMLGIWLDNKFHTTFSWTLTLLFTGLLIGCLNAWYWVDKEDKKMSKK